MRYVKYAANGQDVLGVQVVGEALPEGSYNTAETSAENGKPYLVPIVDVVKPDVNPLTHRLSSPTYSLVSGGARETFQAVALSAEEAADMARAAVTHALLPTDYKMARVSEEIYAMLKGEIADISDEAKAVIAERQSLRGE